MHVHVVLPTYRKAEIEARRKKEEEERRKQELADKKAAVSTLHAILIWGC